jgi:hypothetical protein
MGLEDDHDIGVKYMHTGEKFEYQLHFQKCKLFGNNTENFSNRYSYDVVGRNKEINSTENSSTNLEKNLQAD